MLTKFKKLTKSWAEKQKKKRHKSRIFRALTMCKKCYTFYYQNSWHFEKPGSLEPKYEDDTAVPVHFTQCSACLQQEDAMYETESNLVLETG